jgi:hypothetical protein
MLVDNCEVMIPEAVQETIRAKGIKNPATPLDGSHDSACCLNIFEERTGWSKKPGMQLVFQGIQSAGQRSDNPGGSSLFDLGGT